MLASEVLLTLPDGHTSQTETREPGCPPRGVGPILPTAVPWRTGHRPGWTAPNPGWGWGAGITGTRFLRNADSVFSNVQLEDSRRLSSHTCVCVSFPRKPKAIQTSFPNLPGGSEWPRGRAQEERPPCPLHVAPLTRHPVRNLDAQHVLGHRAARPTGWAARAASSQRAPGSRGPRSAAPAAHPARTRAGRGGRTPARRPLSVCGSPAPTAGRRGSRPRPDRSPAAPGARWAGALGGGRRGPDLRKARGSYRGAAGSGGAGVPGRGRGQGSRGRGSRGGGRRGRADAGLGRPRARGRGASPR